ncbi:hypothetical protein [Deinococcus hohokamensis]|uniref:Uncharacterized protein n=1 Tax=Deinococcus hohokamensis TaxID=309883 RepID=A0ABV9I8T2_9DEIO
MEKSVQDVTEEVSGFTRRVEIRLVQSERKTLEKGKVVKTPGPDPLRIANLVRHDIERVVQGRYGEDTELTFSVAQVQDIRLHGTFPEKAPQVRAVVQGALSEALENLDAIDE